MTGIFDLAAIPVFASITKLYFTHHVTDLLFHNNIPSEPLSTGNAFSECNHFLYGEANLNPTGGFVSEAANGSTT